MALLILSFTGIAVSTLILRLKAKELCSDTRIGKSAMSSACELRQPWPSDLEDLEEKTIQFYRFVITARQRHGYLLSRIFNMDETPMRFELPSSKTLEFSGSRTVPVVLKRGALQ